MPTILRIQSWRFFFFSLEGNEPPHIPVEEDSKVAKYWIKPAMLAANRGFRAHELHKIRQLVIEHEEHFWEAWYAHFG